MLPLELQLLMRAVAKFKVKVGANKILRLSERDYSHSEVGIPEFQLSKGSTNFLPPTFVFRLWPLLASTTVNCGGNEFILQDTLIKMLLKLILHATLNFTE